MVLREVLVDFTTDDSFDAWSFDTEVAAKKQCIKDCVKKMIKYATYGSEAFWVWELEWECCLQARLRCRRHPIQAFLFPLRKENIITMRYRYKFHAETNKIYRWMSRNQSQYHHLRHLRQWHPESADSHALIGRSFGDNAQKMERTADLSRIN